MARSRNIKPGLFTNEILGTVDPYLTLLFEGLWCEADKEGRLEDRPLKINVKVFPYRNFTLKKIDGLLNELTALGFITRYQVSGAAIIQVVNFRKHQAPHSTEKESVLPEEPVAEVSQNQSVSEVTEVVALPNASLTEVVALPNASSTEVEESGIRNQESGIRNQESGKEVELIFRYWQDTLNHPRATLTLERRNAIRGRLVKYSVDEIKQAINNLRVSPHNMGDNDRGTVYDDIELICRNDTKLERFRDLVQKNGTHQNTPQKWAVDLSGLKK